MKKLKPAFISILLLISIINIPFIVKADSGLDAKYDSNTSVVGSLLSSGSSGLSFVGELISAQPGAEEYNDYHITLSIICLIIFYIFTSVYIFKLDKTKPKKAKRILVLLALSLIPTFVFALFCLLTKLQLILYIIVLIIYIIVVIIITKIITKKKFKSMIVEVKKIDKKFNEEELNKSSFDIYKEIQLSWMNFELNKIKKLVSDDIYNDYKTKLETLKNDNQKNIMDKIEFKSNEIVDIKIENNIEIIECKMSIECYDYIINNEEKVVKGNKNKKNKYLYRLVFHKNLDTNKYILVEKKLLEQK